MTRPRCCFNIGYCPKATSFTPKDVPAKRLKTIELTPEEAEALRLKNLVCLDQTAAAKRMHVSQSTFQRVLSSAYKKVSKALIEGSAIKIAAAPRGRRRN